MIKQDVLFLYDSEFKMLLRQKQTSLVTAHDTQVDE